MIEFWELSQTEWDMAVMVRTRIVKQRKNRSGQYEYRKGESILPLKIYDENVEMSQLCGLIAMTFEEIADSGRDGNIVGQFGQLYGYVAPDGYSWFECCEYVESAVMIEFGGRMTRPRMRADGVPQLPPEER